MPWLNVILASKKIGVSKRTLYNWIRDGKVKVMMNPNKTFQLVWIPDNYVPKLRGLRKQPPSDVP